MNVLEERIARDGVVKEGNVLSLVRKGVPMQKIKIRRFTAIALSTMMSFSLAACGGGSADRESQNTAAASSINQEDSSTSEEKVQKDTSDAVRADVQNELEYVADLNDCGVDDLIVNYSDSGYVDFLGAAYTDDKILSIEDALASIDSLVGVAGLDDIEFAFYREDVSPVSGYTYYTFSQIASGEDEDLPVTYSNSQIRVIADEEGNSAGFSADVIYPGSIQKLSKDNMVEQSEAEELVEEWIDDNSSIIDEMTQLTYWDDEAAASTTSTGKIIPVWLVYTNQSTEGKPYTMYVISAQRDSDDQAVVCDRIALNALNADTDSYTSNIFFEGMEDGGTYTYHVDMTWAYEADTGYQAEKELDITVPVMHDPNTGLYYLADYNEKIAAANYYDFQDDNEVNALVSENPDDINSWHFASMTGAEGEEYFCNADYVIAAFDTMLKAYTIYKERYGYNSVDMSELPILLLMNECDGEYPTDPSDFTRNANNMGMWHDWAVFGTSPAYTGCVEVGTMAHEFAHGINGQLTNAHYLNDMGAVMEGYADSIGENLALLYGYKDSSYANLVGSEYSEPVRSFSDPYTFQNAKYINGMYYVNPVSEYASGDYDEGGVHENSSIVNYLCYCLSNNKDSSKAVIDLGKNVDMFIETLYCATYNTGFDELGAYLLFATDFVDLTDEQLQYVYDTVCSLGFAGDSSELDQLISEDGGYTYSLTLECDENLEGEAVFEVMLIDDKNDTEYIAGGTDEEGTVSLILPERSEYETDIEVTLLNSGETVGTFITDALTADEDLTVPTEYRRVNVGDTVRFDNCIFYETEYLYSTGSRGEVEVKENQTELTCDEEGIYCLSMYDDEGNDIFVMVEAV